MWLQTFSSTSWALTSCCGMIRRCGELKWSSLSTHKCKQMINNCYSRCISAWNDNGKESLIDLNATSLLYRTDFFPGLGWMLSRDLWTTELGPKWPKSFWDDWIRNPEQRKGRACIRPEISRTRTFGKIGVSK